VKKQLSILTGLVIVVFFSSQSAGAAKIDTSASMDDTYRSNSSAIIAAFLPAAAIHANYVNGIFSDGFNSGKTATFGLFKSLMSLTAIPLAISPGNTKKTGVLTLAKEKVLLGSPGRNRFSYPAIALRIKF
jgi:hypothetical protein